MTSGTRPVNRRSAGFRLAVAPTRLDFVGSLDLRDGAAWDDFLASAHERPGGRGPSLTWTHSASGETIRIRPGRRGGWLASWLGDRYVSGARVRRELAAWCGLWAQDVPLPEPVLAAARRRGPFWRTWLATIERPRARDGLRWLEEDCGDERLAEAVDALASTLRRFHDAGAIHGDLQLRNLLFEDVAESGRDERVACHLIDLDRVRRVSRISPAERMRDGMRLARSIEKLGLAGRIPADLRTRALDRYCEGDATLRSELLARLPRESRRLARHRLSWRFARRLRALARLAPALALAFCCSACTLDSQGLTEPVEAARRSLLAVGDTGRTRPLARFTEGQLAVAKAMTEEVRARPVDGLVLLGDNFYWNGLDHEHLVARLRRDLVGPYCHFLRLDGPRSHEVADACAQPRETRAPVPIFAVLGNHDIETTESIQLEREVVPEFLPDWRMSRGLAEVFELGDGISLILFESEPSIDDPDAIGRAIEAAVREARGPWRILATHRPIATDDLGNRRLGGYPDFVRRALAASGRPVQLVLAAHHHNLQVFEVGDPVASLQIGAGSGARAEPPLSLNHPDARFGRLALGFVRVDLLGFGRSERLAVSLIETPSLPILSPFVKAHRVARFEVDRGGRVTASDIAGPAFEPGQQDPRQGPRERS